MNYTGYTNKQLLAEFRKLVNQASTLKDCKEIAKKFRDILVQKYKSKTVISYLVKYRKFVRNSSKDQRQKQALLQYLEVNEHTKRKERRKDQDTIKRNYLKPFLIAEDSINKMIDLAISTLEKNINNVDKFNFGECVVSLILLTGRRITEVAKTGKIYAHRDTKSKYTEQTGLTDNQVNDLLDGIENVVRFTGQLKTKGSEKVLYIPVLHDRVKLIKLFNQVRDIEKQRCIDKGIKTHSQLSIVQSEKRTSYINESVVNKLFGEFFEQKITTHDLRKCYMAYVFYKYGAGKNQSALYTYVLGHWNNVKSTSFKSYLNFSIVKKAPVKKTEKKVTKKATKQLLIRDNSTKLISEFYDLRNELNLSSAELLEKLLTAYKVKTSGMTKKKQIEIKLQDMLTNKDHAITSYKLRQCTYADGGKFSAGMVQQVMKENKEKIDKYNLDNFPKKYRK